MGKSNFCIVIPIYEQELDITEKRRNERLRDNEIYEIKSGNGIIKIFMKRI